MAALVATPPGWVHAGVNHINKLTIAKQTNMCLEYHVPTEIRHLYGMRDLVIHASSDPSHSSCICADNTSTWNPIKNMFALEASNLEEVEFTEIYENIHDNIVTRIVVTLSDADWGLNVLRLGFDTERLSNPITIHLVVANGGLAEDRACRIVADILAVIAAIPTLSQIKSKIHIDICARACDFSGVPTPSFSLLDRNPEVYESPARLPYSSVGPIGIDSIGSLSGYVQYCDEDGRKTVYALTCRHVVDPNCSFDNKPYAEGAIKRQVACPAVDDHANTQVTITDVIAELRFTHTGTTVSQSEIYGLEQTLEKAKLYDTELGYVHTTSGSGRLLPQSQSRSDWATISITNPAIPAENKHVRSSGRFRSFGHPSVPPLLNDGIVLDARQYFAPGPYFKPIRYGDLDPGELVFKPRSRTTKECTAGKFNGIRSTQKYAGLVTREWCFISLFSKAAMSAPGDSGSIIVDRDFRPIAMLWGGNEHNFAYGPQDVTYASPLFKVMRDIEERNGWTKGSVLLAA